MSDTKEPLKIYLDDNQEPFKVDHPPLRFPLSTLPLADGEHVLRVEASNGLAPPTIKEIPFRVRNGVAVTVSGLEPEQTVAGQVELIVNAYAGNTEVDFEPRRAETPQPIPTWAWVLFLGVTVWSLFYLLNPVRPPRVAAATTFEVGRDLGERLYMDTCARCHGEDGRGKLAEASDDNYFVKKLRDTPRLALDETPYKLLFKVVTGTRASGNVQMPPWGPRMTNEEIVAVVNFVRTSWGHDASQIQPKYRRPPPGIEKLEADILDAMTEKDVERMSFCCWPDRIRPQLYRIDGPRWAVGRDEVLTEWKGYFEALEDSTVADFQLTDVRYDYEPESVDEIGAYVFAMGRIFLSTEDADGNTESDTGRFIRVYRKVRNGRTKADGSPDSQWALLFDFASIRMRVGCEVTEDCPPGHEPGAQDGDGDQTSAGMGTGTGDTDTTDSTDTTDGTDTTDTTDTDTTDATDTTGPAAADGITRIVGYKQIQQLFRDLARDPGDSGHERFWDVGHEEFVGMSFPFSWDNVDETVQLLEVGNSKQSNLIKALVDGKGIKVRLENGDFETRSIARMPKGAPPMPPAQIRMIADWIDAKCPLDPGYLDASGTFVKGEPPAGTAGKTEPDKDEPKKAEPKKDEPKKSASTGGASVSPIGFADVKAIFAGLGRDAGDSGHERFWDLSHEEFCNLVFPLSWDDVDSMIKMIEPYDGKNSNMIKALIDGKGITYTDADGNLLRTNIARMPKGGAPMAADDIAKLTAWIDAGCPKEVGGAPFFPKPGGAEAPKDAPKDEPAKKDPPKAEKPKTSNLGFDEVMDIFKKLRQKAPNAPHSNYWKELDYQEFITFSFPLKYGQPGMIRMLIPYDSENSNMIRAIRDGRGIVLDMPNGKTKTVDIAPMPKDADPMAPEVIQQLCDWIDAGCPEFAGKPSALPRPGQKEPTDGGNPPPPPPGPNDKPKDAPPPAAGDGGFPAPGGGG